MRDTYTKANHFSSFENFYEEGLTLIDKTYEINSKNGMQ